MIRLIWRNTAIPIREFLTCSKIVYAMDASYITPVEKRGAYWFKREDLYKPYDFSPANGSKLRQCQLLIEKNISLAANGIITGTSILSPQAVIAASVARGMEIPCHVYYGGTTEKLLYQKKYPKLARDLGADVSIVAKMAYTSVLAAKAEEYAKANNMFHIRYGFDLRANLDVFVESVARQVQNMPKGVKNLVVTVGSSITLIGILYGMAMYDNNIEKVYAIGCAPNRLKKIQDYSTMIYFESGTPLPFQKIVYIDAFNTEKGYKYENIMYEQYFGINFHPRYEAKAFHWLRNKALHDCLFWVTGADFA